MLLATHSCNSQLHATDALSRCKICLQDQASCGSCQMPAVNRMDVMCTTSKLPRQLQRSSSWRTGPGVILHLAHGRPLRHQNLQQTLPCLSKLFVPFAAPAKRTIQASVQAVADRPLEHRKKVVGLGLACWDFLAQVAAFPKPDEKLRTQRMEVNR